MDSMVASKRLSFLIRADASVEIGSGHVMRCLALANKVKQRGHDTTFMCRQFSGHLGQLIVEQGHELIMLPEIQNSPPQSSDLTHSHWLGTSQDEDIVACESAIGERNFDWLIVDHYGVDKVWQQEMRRHTGQVLVIDDLADRQHDCDVLLDQNFGRKPGDYAGLVPSDCDQLLGPKFALLRDEFAHNRRRALDKHAKQPNIKNILISMGGADKDNATGTILSAISTASIDGSIKLTIVLGPSSPYVEHIGKQLKQLEQTTDLLMGTNRMAELMLEADIAFGAAGSSSWERACLGLPTLLITIADNQEPAAKALDNFGAAIWVGRHDESEIISLIQKNICRLQDPKVRRDVITNALSICDGLGVERVCAAILEQAK